MGKMRFSLVENFARGAKIKVVGVGGAGGNAIKRMVEAGVCGVEFVAINTDLQSLEKLDGYRTVQIGVETTRGLGAGGDAEVGRLAAEENREDIMQALSGADLVITTFGGGGGTGSGSGPVVVDIARELGALTVAIVTRPFQFERAQRMQRAEDGIRQLRGVTDTLIVIPNQKLVDISLDVKLTEAFQRADSILVQATKGISELLTTAGEINLDFNDLSTVMKGGGDALLGFGTASGEDRALNAATQAISSPFLEDIDVAGARSILINVSASRDITLREFDTAVKVITDKTGNESNVIAGMAYNDDITDELRVTLIATGLRQDLRAQPKQESFTLQNSFTGNSFSNGATNGFSNGNGKTNGDTFRTVPVMPVAAPALDASLRSNGNSFSVPAILRRNRS
ncbi:MAG: cell division protein FtsZ [bacterium]|nr:cell division protein FtsZ [bacterium]